MGTTVQPVGSETQEASNIGGKRDWFDDQSGIPQENFQPNKVVELVLENLSSMRGQRSKGEMWEERNEGFLRLGLKGEQAKLALKAINLVEPEDLSPNLDESLGLMEIIKETQQNSNSPKKHKVQ